MLSFHHRSICCQIFGQVGDGIAGDGDGACGPGRAGGCLRVDPGGMVHEVCVKTGVLDLLLVQISGELVDDGPHHLQMPQFLCADIGQQPFQLRIRHGVALAEIAQRRAEFAVRTTVLTDDKRCQLGVGVFDIDGILQLLLVDKHQPFPPFSQGHGSRNHA